MNSQEAVSETILHNGKVRTPSGFASAVSVRGNKIHAVGDDAAILKNKSANALVIDLNGRTVIPGLIDSHLHLIRGGLNYNLELRWDGINSLAEALSLLKMQVDRTPAPQWVRVVGGWCEFQFKEKRLPSLEEINKIAPDTPVFLLHLYDRAILNRAALRAVGYDKDTPNPPGGEIQKDESGNPTGLLIARPNAQILYATLAKGPRLAFEDQVNSTRQFMRELNSLGVTSVIDAGGGYQNYPEDYAVVDTLHKENQMTVRIAYNLFTQKPKQEQSDFERWIEMTKPGAGDHFSRMNGAGEMLVFSAADFEDFLEPRPDLDASMETELEAVVRTLATARWPFRLHATYNETIERALTVFEKIDKEVPFNGLHWFFDHAETITQRNLERVRALGGGIAIQHRMAFQGEYFIQRYGKEAAASSPPVRHMLDLKLPVGAGTDATRVASYNPFVALSWLTTGRTVGGTSLYPSANLLSRDEALKLYTEGSAWFSNEETLKGRIEPNYLADLAVLNKDYFSIDDDEIRGLRSTLTIVDGKIVYASDEFAQLAPPELPVSPSWSPLILKNGTAAVITEQHASRSICHKHHLLDEIKALLKPANWQWRECDCFVF